MKRIRDYLKEIDREAAKDYAEGFAGFGSMLILAFMMSGIFG